MLLPHLALSDAPDMIALRGPGYQATVPVQVHVTERTDGRWSCARGQVVSVHDRLPEAIAHVREITTTSRRADVLIHWKDGQVDNIGAI